MKLSAIGEFGFIARFSPPFLKDLASGSMGIGDDCAVIPWQEGASLLVTTDMLVEDIHFLRKRIPPRDLGYKSLAVNLSDIAAMGGAANSAYLSLGIPPDVEVEWLDEFFIGLRELADKWEVRLLGGDTTRSPGPLIINLAVLGRAENRRLKYRSSARVGDIIAVTGLLGDSAAGLMILLEDRELDEDAAFLLNCHHRPSPGLAEGVWLADWEEVHAMMDVSDGIDSDLQRIMERSRCGARVILDDLPLSDLLRQSALRYGWKALELAAAGGEDYCLLTTIAPEAFSGIQDNFQERFGKPLYRIGVVTEKEEGLCYLLSGKPSVLSKTGFNHFS
ncbi:MAG: thiamine-phosphate kinase [Smithellaceae bacterium]|nr:thiamine-phosphate kinase [Smithellaceae bacterium]